MTAPTSPSNDGTVTPSLQKRDALVLKYFCHHQEAHLRRAIRRRTLTHTLLNQQLGVSNQELLETLRRLEVTLALALFGVRTNQGQGGVG